MKSSHLKSSSVYTFAHLNRRFIYRHLGYAEMLNITKEVYQSRSNRLPKDIQRRRPQESAFRMSKGEKEKAFEYENRLKEYSNK